MRTSTRAALVATGLCVAVFLVLTGYLLYRQYVPETCRICRRPIHPEARAVIEESGKREAVCCVRCGLFLEVQRRSPVRLVEVTDYVSGRPLRPDAAYYVEGSRTILCDRHEPLLDETKHPYARVFDRCTPSLFAFASQEEAQAFTTRNGGTVRRLPEILQEVRADHD